MLSSRDIPGWAQRYKLMCLLGGLKIFSVRVWRDPRFAFKNPEKGFFTAETAFYSDFFDWKITRCQKPLCLIQPKICEKIMKSNTKLFFYHI